MRRIRSSSGDLHGIFRRSLQARFLAEPLVSFDSDAEGATVRRRLAESSFDTAGVRQHGIVSGYARTSEISDGPLGRFMHPFQERDLIEDTAPLTEAIVRLRSTEQVFLLVFGKPAGIITRGDLQKIPVRMWLFGLISLIEMQMLRVIRISFPSGEWESLLSPERRRETLCLFEERKTRNVDITTGDCLQFCDKRTILLKSDWASRHIGKGGKGRVRRFLEELEMLRNNLSHAQDFGRESLIRMIGLAEEAEQFLEDLEKV